MVSLVCIVHSSCELPIGLRQWVVHQQMDNLDVTDTHYDKKYQIYRDDWMLNMIE